MMTMTTGAAIAAAFLLILLRRLRQSLRRADRLQTRLIRALHRSYDRPPSPLFRDTATR